MDTDLPRRGQPSRAGELLGERYRLVRPIGAGGMAVVWEAWDTVLARTVAVKLLRHAGDPQSRAQVRREARAAAALAHPNVAQVYDYGESAVIGGRVPYVVLELVRGGTLQQRLATGEVTARFALRICAEVGAALAAAHAEGLVHRDIKPANVMLAPTGVKVVDFGIAAAIAPRGTGEPDEEVFGTPSYLAPERLTDNAVEPASDVYALGVLLYRLLSGRTPWPERSTTRMLAAHLYEPPPPLVPRTAVPGQVLDLCERCLRKDPAERPTAREVTRLLAAAAGLEVVEDEPAPAAPGSAPAAEPSIVVRPPVRARGRLAVALAVAAAAATGAVAAWALLPRASAPTPAAPAASAPAALGDSPAAPTPARSAAPVPPPKASDPARVSPRTPPTRAAVEPPSPTTRVVPPPTSTTAPSRRTLTSAGGTVTATCATATTAEILSWSATKPYKTVTVDTAPGPAPKAQFRHGNDRITMTVTCTDGIPSADLA
jgi:serine/threonine-protein kinase